MNSERTIKQDIENALKEFDSQPIRDAATRLLDILGYRSKRISNDELDNEKYNTLFESALETSNPSKKLRLEKWQSYSRIMQITDEEINQQRTPERQFLFESTNINENLRTSYMFVAVELEGDAFTRTQLADITRFICKKAPYSIMVMFRYSDYLSLAIINRRHHKRDKTKQVLEKVTLIKDINLNKPNRAHIEIIYDLYLLNLIQTKEVKNFDTLHDEWEKILNTEELNKKFYRKLFAWYEWAVETATFPTDENRVLKPEEHVIRLITRLLFIWFIKEKGLVADELFDKAQIRNLLVEDDFDNGDSYYRAVLQNLFFATLNTEIDKRAFSKETYDTNRDFSCYRYKKQMDNADKLLSLFAQTPFINGGLFDCLDTFKATGKESYRIDCFSDKQYHKLSIPNRLFFDVQQGLIPLLEHYKFTVEENTPIEQEVALDPELLGRVFEHLLAEYNPETREIASSARKETGSYYTPRAIVDYMVEEALVATLSQKCQPTDSNEIPWDERLRYLLDYAQMFDDASEWFDDRETDAIVKTISELKILDPAVGSGAFPMGMLHKLTLALKRLDSNNTQWEELQKELAGKRAKEAFNTQNQQERDDELKEISQTFERYQDSDFGRKLYLIQNSIFGVDIQPVACQIAKLRFFISLAIEQQRDRDAENFGIKPLPNLETRFVAADTLIGLDISETEGLFQDDTVQQLLKEIDAIHEKFFLASNRGQKRKLEEQEDDLREQLEKELERQRTEWIEIQQAEIERKIVQLPNPEQREQLRETEQKAYESRKGKFDASFEDARKIAQWKPYDQNEKADWFDPEWMFGITEGYDVVIGNPPYSKSENVPDDRSEQLTAYHGWGDDLYGYFIFSGFKLVSEQGIFTYIANDSFVTFSTKRRIRDLFLENQLMHLVKAPANTFEATIYTAIFILLKAEIEDQHSYMSGEMNFPDFEYIANGVVEYATVCKIPDCKFLLSAKNDWVLRLFALENVEEYCEVLDTGIDSGNVRSKIFFKENNGSRHRLLQGKQIQRYSIQWDSPKAKYKFCDVNYEPLPIPGIGRGGKPSKRNEYWKFRGDIEHHHQPERLLIRQSDDDLIVAYHSEVELGRFYTDNTLHTILPKSQKTNLKYFLALFNSRLMNYIYHSISQEKGKSQAQVKIKVVRELPVVVPTEEEQLPIIALVDEILEAKAADPCADTAKKEEKIDKLVYALYDLTDDEIAIVEGSV